MAFGIMYTIHDKMNTIVVLLSMHARKIRMIEYFDEYII